MQKFLSLPTLPALFLGCALSVAAQSTPSIDRTAPIAPAPSSMSSPAQTQFVLSPDEVLKYFSLEHRSAEQMDPADAAILKLHVDEIAAEAEFYGYRNNDPWTYEQVVCPMMPNHLMLRYTSSLNGGEAQSIFTALVPRETGKVRIVPVLHHSATQFHPAVGEKRNFEIFRQAVPPGIAKLNSGPDGKWLTMSVCYAEMTGARPEVPNKPQLNLKMIKAPQPTLRISVNKKVREVTFIAPISETDYRRWVITYNRDGVITAANDNEHAFGEIIVQHPHAPEPIQKPAPKEPPVKPMAK